MAEINAYLNFAGTCEEAFNFYKSVFGGEFTQVSRFSEVPKEAKMYEVDDQKIMHISLPVGKQGILMGSDTPEAMGKVVVGNNFSISIQVESEEEAKKLFDGISIGGTITMPLNKTFWNAYFGMCTDKFGIQWMVNYDYSKK